MDKLFPDIKDTLASKHKNNKVEDSFINEDERKQIEDKRNQNENELINIDTYDEKKRNL